VVLSIPKVPHHRRSIRIGADIFTELGDLVRKSGYCVLAPACPMWVLKEVSEQLRERKLASIGRLNPGSGSSISLSTRHALNPVTDFIHGKIKTPWTFHAAEKKVEAVVPEAPKPASGFDSDTDDEYTAIQTTKYVYSKH